RKDCLDTLLTAIGRGGLDMKVLLDLSSLINGTHRVGKRKKILAVGEPSIVFNELLNDYTFSKLEASGHKIVYSPLSEKLWLLWRDHYDHNRSKQSKEFKENLTRFRKLIDLLRSSMPDSHPFEVDPSRLIENADRNMGYYSGGFGRYRGSKVLSDIPEIEGVLSVSSTDENTGISLGLLNRKIEKEAGTPLLNLTFDGYRKSGNEQKVETFIYYL
ncbi:MAG: hypothetical protein PQJ60_00710, partial [Spirochaetales bacterium]|nr:hypothetical protein [Spirochaetales bacterium]